MTARNRPIVTCASCGRHRPHKARGLCSACHQRHSTHGGLEQYPRSRYPTGRVWIPTSRYGRRMLQRYQELAAVRPPLSKKHIAFELGVSVRQVERYAAALAALGSREPASA